MPQQRRDDPRAGRKKRRRPPTQQHMRAVPEWDDRNAPGRAAQPTAEEEMRRRRARKRARRRRKMRRRLAVLAAAGLLLTAGLVLVVLVLFRAEGLRVDVGEVSVYYRLPQPVKENAVPTPVPPVSAPQSEPGGPESGADTPDSAPGEPQSGVTGDGTDAVGLSLTWDDDAAVSLPQAESLPDDGGAASDEGAQSGETADSAAAPEQSPRPVTRYGVPVVSGEEPVEGTRYTPQQMARVLGLEKGKTIFSVSAKKAAAKLEQAMPYLEKIRVRYRLPGTIVVQAQAAQPRYAVYWQEQWLVVSASMKTLEVTPEQPQGLVALTAGSLQPQIGTELALYTEPEPVDEAAILNGGENDERTDEEKLDDLKKAKEAAKTAAEERTALRTHTLQQLLLQLEKWGLAEDVTAIDVSDEQEAEFTYQDRIRVLVGTENQLDYKIQFVADILQKQLSATDRGRLDAGSLRTDNSLQPVFAREG